MKITVSRGVLIKEYALYEIAVGQAFEEIGGGNNNFQYLKIGPDQYLGLTSKIFLRGDFFASNSRFHLLPKGTVITITTE